MPTIDLDYVILYNDWFFTFLQKNGKLHKSHKIHQSPTLTIFAPTTKNKTTTMTSPQLSNIRHHGTMSNIHIDSKLDLTTTKVQI